MRRPTDWWRAATSLVSSFRSPKWIARVGQACAQAGTISPPRIARRAFLARCFPPMMGWMLKRHFAITPRARVVIGGWLTSTMVTLVLVPAVYTIFEEGLSGIFRKTAKEAH